MDSFSIVFLCTGNRFRSPFAQAFVERLTLGLPVHAVSRGVLRLRSAPPLSEALELAPWFGVDISQHRAQQLDAASTEQADLVLGFEHTHVQYAVIDAGAERSRTFTLPEFVHLTEALPGPTDDDVAAAARARVEEAAILRNENLASRMPDIEDPFGQSWKKQCAIASEIRELVIALVASLFGAVEPTGLPALPLDVARRRRGRSIWSRTPRR